MRSPERKGWTILLVPSSGGGEVRQWSVTRRRVRIAVTTAAAVGGALVVAFGVQLGTLDRVIQHSALVEEISALRLQIAETDERLAALEPLIERVRAFDEQLRGLSGRGMLPGTGPLDAEDLAAREAWIAGVVPISTGPSEGVNAVADALEGLDLAGMDDAIDRWTDRTAAMPEVWPAEGTVTSGFGYRRNPFGHIEWKYHGGLDIGASYGSAIYATNDGLITFAGWDSGHGKTVDLDHASGVSSRYCHASQILVEQGQEVLAGQVIALVGSTGISTGPHLHYELYLDGERVDPRPYLPADNL